MSLFLKVKTMKKNEIYKATCTGYTDDGLGVTRIDNVVIFVPGLIVGEEAEIGITKMKNNYGYGRVVNITKASKHRIQPKCSIYKPCGGCQLQHMDDYAQREFKMEKVKACFRNNAGMEIEPLPIIKVEPYWNYRNKVQIPVQYNNNTVEMGFYQNHTNRIVQYETCHVQTQLSNTLTHYFKQKFEQYHIAKQLRHVLIKHAHVTGEVMVCFVVRNWPFQNSDKLVNDILQDYPQIQSLSCIVNRRDDNVILDGKEILLAKKPYIEEELLGCKFRISPRSFFQINPYATKELYSTALEYAQLTGKETLLDLYCGTGTMGIIGAKKAKQVYGIEIVADAIKDAKINAEANDIHNIQFINADASKGAQMLIRSKIKIDAMIVDPPRKGCSKETLNAIFTIAPNRLVYVSCDPATLARDVKIITDNGYTLEKVQPCDMFPQTIHVETVCLLSQRKPDAHIEVNLELSELELSSAETKATYEEIKSFVLEKHGLRVTNLYIAQVKRECGIVERENYNLPKTEGNRVPQCPEDKRLAIKDAFRHFKMI